MVQLNPLRDLFWQGKHIPIYTLSKILVLLAEFEIVRVDGRTNMKFSHHLILLLQESLRMTCL